MIDHIYYDGSRGHEFEVGDRVICLKEDFSLRGTPMGYVGRKGTVERLAPYNKDSTYHTTFVCVRLDGGGFTKHLNSQFEPDCEPRKEVEIKS